MSEFRKLLEELNSLNTEDEIKEFVRKRIDYLEKNSKVRKISNAQMIDDKVVYGNNYEGYINSDSPITTSFMVDPFYINDFNLYYDFVKQIKGKDLSNLLSIFYEFLSYTKELFNFKGEQKNRESVYLQERDGEISIADFYHNKSALCSERSAAVHNLASFLNIKSYLIFGELDVDGKSESHAYNIFQAVDGTLILYDPTNPVIINRDGNISYAPAFSIIGKQNIEDIVEVDFDFNTLLTIHKANIDEDEKPRKYYTYKYQINKQRT